MKFYSVKKKINYLVNDKLFMILWTYLKKEIMSEVAVLLKSFSLRRENGKLYLTGNLLFAVNLFHLLIVGFSYKLSFFTQAQSVSI